MEIATVGRDLLVAQVWSLLAARGRVLLEGGAGIGKTTLWRAATARAERAGWPVLSCAPAESETTLPFAALADLLRPLAAEVAGLPHPQRVAAEAVLLAAEVDESVDERAVGAATRSLLDTAAAGSGTGRVLVAVDDAPWLDPPSERALRFALRRTAAEVVVLVTARTTGETPAAMPLGLETARSEALPARVEVPPLEVGALHHILRNRLGVTLGRPLLTRLAHEAGGNPLLTIELTRAVLRLPRLPLPGEDLPVAASLQQVLADTLRLLPTPARDAVRLAALLSVPTHAELRAAGVGPEVFEPAEEAGLLTVAPDAVEFSHPAYATAVRAGIPPGVRRRLHRALADAVADPDERARHLARASTAPDAAVARELAAAAQRHHRRGAAGLAAELHERAAELTPATLVTAQARQRLAAARCRFDSGDYAAAESTADAVAHEFTGDLRAEALLLRAVVAWAADDIDSAIRAAEQGLTTVVGDDRLTGSIHLHLSMFVDGPERARRHAAAAAGLLTEEAGDRGMLSAALLLLFFAEVRAGLPVRTGLLERALALEGEKPSWLAATIPAIYWRSTDQHHRARDRLQLLLRRAVAGGDEPLQHELISHLGETELLAGRWAAAAVHIAAARELGEQLGTGLLGENWLAGTLDACQGRLAEAQAAAETGLRHAAAKDDPWCRRIYLHLAAFVALCAGRMADAATAYGDIARTADTAGLTEPLSLRFEPDWIEACVGSGDHVGAAAVLERLAARHARLPRPWTTLGLARSRLLLAVATGADPGPAQAEVIAARAAYPADVLPLDRARCLLVAGRAYRRQRRRRQARTTLTAALEEFTALGAEAFAAQARAELARLGGRPPAPSGLTAAEERVARLAARGLTNRDIAGRLFISAKTVEANLARVYRKLGIVRRAELATRLAADAPNAPGDNPSGNR